jgi:predicted transposase YdaD
MLSERIRKWPERWLEEGREEGKLEARREMARNLIANTDMDDKAIAGIADLPVAEVARLRGEYHH